MEIPIPENLGFVIMCNYLYYVNNNVIVQSKDYSAAHIQQVFDDRFKDFVEELNANNIVYSAGFEGGIIDTCNFIDRLINEYYNFPDIETVAEELRIDTIMT